LAEQELFSRFVRKALSRGGDYADIFLEERRSTTIQLEDRKVEKVITGFSGGVGIRLIHDGKTAYAFTNDSSRETLFDLADSVSRAASGTEKDLVLDMRRRAPAVTFPVRVPPEGVSMSRKIEAVTAADRAAHEYHTAVRQVTVSCRDARQKVAIYSSDGFWVEDERVHTTGVVHVVAADGQTVQTGHEHAGGLVGYELYDEQPLETMALTSARRAVRMLGARRVPGGRMPVVISSEAGGTMIHEAIGHGLEADLARQGLSVYSGKIGEQVASPAVTVIDDATLPRKRGSFCFDDEGTPSGRNVLVSEGVLVGYLYDKYNAMIDGRESTGNGRRESYEHKPIPRMTNTFIAPGTATPEEVLRSVTSGLYVERMGGGQVNTVTGDFVFEVQEGYLIEKGGIGELVRGATLVGNGPDVLKSIDMIASDLGFSIGTCGKDAQGVPVSDAMPTLRIAEIVVGGEVR
jgi:TldD protein